MKPQILDLESEALAEFRERFNFAMSSLIGNMIEKGLKTGEVGGKIRIEINQVTDQETGELVLMPVIKPDVHMKVGAKGKVRLRDGGGHDPEADAMRPAGGGEQPDHIRRAAVDGREGSVRTT